MNRPRLGVENLQLVTLPGNSSISSIDYRDFISLKVKLA